ncbi:MAG: ADP-ribosylglycohydrolase family protein [Candidatus Krumholzibacteriota bacterium]|nr:ADP-ribosylglycohydrolase family protein [Candidatus Krumholzibacteriota bacterium]
MSESRLARLHRSLDGLSVGDALGETFFFGSVQEVLARIVGRATPPGPWTWTDDTQMALSVCEILERRGRIDPDHLAQAFARRFDPMRGYGDGAAALLAELRAGGDWRELAPAMFGGTGSFGNGSAMRVAPLGAFYADDLAACVENASLSSRPTHAHPEGEAGAVAVAVAAALAWRAGEGTLPAPAAFLAEVAGQVPPGAVREGLERAAAVPFDPDPAPLAAGGGSQDLAAARAAEILGAGNQVSCQDTVPFALWCAARHLEDYPAALWDTLLGFGDRDTTCAIAGGVVALSARARGVPPAWLAAREPLPAGRGA